MVFEPHARTLLSGRSQVATIRYSVLSLSLVLYLTLTQPLEAQEVISSFPAPAGESRGLAWDGEYLWCADAGTDSVYQLDISDGDVVSSFPFVIDSDFGGLAWSADTSIWIANGSQINMVNPADGNTLSGFTCPGG
jgi:DNA-binding beta-propeller fold protein YncE